MVHGVDRRGWSTPNAARELGAIPIDYRNDDVPARVRELAPQGVAAVFDHVGGPAIVDSWRMLVRGGTLVSYGTASTRDIPGNPRLVLKLLARLAIWNVLPNGRRATFFNPWAGRRRNPERYRSELREDSGQVLELLGQGALTAQIATVEPEPRCALAGDLRVPIRSWATGLATS